MDNNDFNASEFETQRLEPVQETSMEEIVKPAISKKQMLFIIGGACLALCILVTLLILLLPKSKGNSGNEDPTSYTGSLTDTSASEGTETDDTFATTDATTVGNSGATEETVTNNTTEATDATTAETSGATEGATVNTEAAIDKPTDPTNPNRATEPTAPSADTPTTGSDNNTVATENSEPDETVPVSPVKSARPTITQAVQMSPSTFVVTGYCSTKTEKIIVTGNGVTTTEIIPAKGSSNNYFMGTVSVSKGTTTLMVQAQEKGCEPSDEATRMVRKSVAIREDLMTTTEYMPVFAKDSRIHFYSALLAYSLSDVITDAEENRALANMSDVVKKAKNAGSEVIYFVVPSSAAVYPETIPDGYTKASGETVFDVFNRVATQSGAKVIYPLDTMLAHKNDGDGLKIYHNTDSHWSPYGAYWGIYDLMNYIAKDYPAAKPRTVTEMGFYTAELWGGDALFSFSDYGYFETDLAAGRTSRSLINELTALYTKKMPTSTLISSYRNGKGVYSSRTNAGEAVVKNSQGAGLPTAYIIRDSFGCTAYDMINDRFSEVSWQAFNDLAYDHSIVTRKNPDYVIYIISERNLVKIMENNSYLSLLKYVR